MQTWNFIPEALADRLSGPLADAARDFDRSLTRIAAPPLANAVATARSGLYLAESVPLFRLQRALAGDKAEPPAPPAGAQQAILSALRDLMRADGRNLAEGLYPLSVLRADDSVLGHALRYLRLLADSVDVAARKRRSKPREFAGRAAKLARELPAYYQRNYHFQTDGYLSDASADLYEHQVEILFRGLADAMRRQVIPPLKQRFRRRADGRGLRILELAAGCGSTTRFVTSAFPEAQITCVDLSAPYLAAARRRFSNTDRIDYLQGDAADLDLRERRFDAVYSTFLFHELPRRERQRVLAEAQRVLKPSGVHVVVDSLQRGDVPELDWALEEFPRQFHEPFYRDYARTPLEPMIEEAGFGPPAVSTAFLSKVVSARKVAREA